MIICLHCGKLSPSVISGENQKACCPKCRVPIGTAPNGNYIYEKDSSTSTSASSASEEPALRLPPAFGGIVFLSAESEGVIGRYCLKYADSLNIPGTDYNFVLPFQDHVSREIVEQKIVRMQSSTDRLVPHVQVARIAESGLSKVPDESLGRLAIAEDGHHTFVAALKAKVPVWLDLLGGTRSYVSKSWADCTYVEHF